VSPDPYEILAPFYDRGMEGFDDDLPLYLELARRGDQPVLELGCGSGRVALALARARNPVVGIDRSAAMLELAQAKLAQQPELPLSLLRADMRDFALGRRFGLIAIPLDGFLHLQSREEQGACLRGARAHLAEDGLLVLDIAGPASPGWEDWSPGVRPQVLAWSAVLPGGGRLNRYSSFSADAAQQTHDVTEIYERLDADGGVRRWLAAYTLRYAFPAELDLLLEAAGLRVEARYGDYDLSAFEASSPRQIVVAGSA
jgi:SAM-dependent methyltransferase